MCFVLDVASHASCGAHLGRIFHVFPGKHISDSGSEFVMIEFVIRPVGCTLDTPWVVRPARGSAFADARPPTPAMQIKYACSG